MLVADIPSLPDGVAGALRAASARSGTPFEYLLRTAIRESGLDPSARARTSSASGLFQFIEQTWLELVKEEGPRLGLTAEAAAIERTSRGTYRVPDAAARRHILSLREDPAIAALMAGEFSRRNADRLSAELGRTPTEGELYIAHFLGAGGAVRLISHAMQSPDAPAPDIFPKQAAANRAIFYAGPRARSVSEVYANLVAKHGDTAPPAAPLAAQDTLMAYAPVAAGASAAAEAIRSRFALIGADEQERRADAPPARHEGRPETPLPSRFALAALQMLEDGLTEETGTAVVPHLRPLPGSGWSDEGEIEPAQLLPIAGRFSPR